MKVGGTGACLVSVILGFFTAGGTAVVGCAGSALIGTAAYTSCGTERNYPCEFL